MVVAIDAAPLPPAERVQALDVLRGLALFGVFLMNFVGFAGRDVMATQSQLLSLPTAGLDHAVEAVLRCALLDKANTVFAFLFGLGFYLQMQRLDARGRDAQRIYRRRLTVLLLIGVAHTFLLWNWDILHLYALAGFLLLAMRSAANRTLVIAGILLAAFGRTAVKGLLAASGSGAGDVAIPMPTYWSARRCPRAVITSGSCGTSSTTPWSTIYCPASCWAGSRTHSGASSSARGSAGAAGSQMRRASLAAGGSRCAFACLWVSRSKG